MAEQDIADLETILCGKNPISRLQEICQQRKLPVPTYRESTGTYSLFANEVTITVELAAISFTGMGRTKKVAKTKAAEEALLFIAATKPNLFEPPAAGTSDEEIPEIRVPVQANKQRSDPLDMRALAKETEELSHVKVNLDMSRLIQQARTKLSMSQKDFATKINERPIVVMDYESGRAIPNHQILAKMERTLGMYLIGERAGQPKIMGRGMKRKAA